MENTKSFLDNYQLEGELLKISKYPASVLKKKAEKVIAFDDELQTICKNMLYTMYKSPGIGLAAPQIGISKRFFVLDIDYKREEITDADDQISYELSEFAPQIFINPILKGHEGEQVYEEGCLSVPGIFEDVTRANFVTIEYQDLFGNIHTMKASEMLAICLQHENDHLDGIIFLERLSMLKRNFLKKKYLKNKNKKK